MPSVRGVHFQPASCFGRYPQLPQDTDRYTLDRLMADIAAAGLSSRMKEFKPLMQLGDKTILNHVIENFRTASCDRIAVVIGFRAENLLR